MKPAGEYPARCPACRKAGTVVTRFIQNDHGPFRPIMRCSGECGWRWKLRHLMGDEPEIAHLPSELRNPDGTMPARTR